MGRQREQMTLNNPDILFIHLSAAWKDFRQRDLPHRIDSALGIFTYEYLFAHIFLSPQLFHHSFNSNEGDEEKIISIDLSAGQVSGN